MRKRRVYLSFFVLLLVGVFLAVFRPEREPEYGGKKLSEWVESYGLPEQWDSSNRFRAACFSNADKAIGHIGTNAVPYLVGWVLYEQPRWKWRLHYRLGAILRETPNRAGFRDKRLQRAAGATLAFKALGSEASQAIPVLSQALTEPERTTSAIYIAAALDSIGAEASPGLVRP